MRPGERVTHTVLGMAATLIGPAPLTDPGWWIVLRDDGARKCWHESYMLPD
jgi:hypothetical protein